MDKKASQRFYCETVTHTIFHAQSAHVLTKIILGIIYFLQIFTISLLLFYNSLRHVPITYSIVLVLAITQFSLFIVSLMPRTSYRVYTKASFQYTVTQVYNAFLTYVLHRYRCTYNKLNRMFQKVYIWQLRCQHHTSQCWYNQPLIIGPYSHDI